MYCRQPIEMYILDRTLPYLITGGSNKEGGWQPRQNTSFSYLIKTFNLHGDLLYWSYGALNNMFTSRVGRKESTGVRVFAGSIRKLYAFLRKFASIKFGKFDQFTKFLETCYREKLQYSQGTTSYKMKICCWILPLKVETGEY